MMAWEDRKGRTYRVRWDPAGRGYKAHVWEPGNDSYYWRPCKAVPWHTGPEEAERDLEAYARKKGLVPLR